MKPIKQLAIFTSGGDSPGMNAALRAIVRTALNREAEIYTIKEGYQGLITAGDLVTKMNWESVGGILHQSGTIIGTARCDAFRQSEGRRIAARHLLEYGIDSLIIIGGDGSLTGADIFRQEWPTLLSELVAAGEVTQDLANAHAHLAIVGLVGSIDNDMYGTDMKTRGLAQAGS